MSSSKPTTLTTDEVAQTGVTTCHERMPNGELRFRMMGPEGDGYVRTIAVPGSGWQRAHYHSGIVETYVVQAGWLVLATLRQGRVTLERVVEGQVVSTEPGVPHNVYLPAGSVVHTVKHGKSDVRDWLPHPMLDTMTHGLQESDLVEIAQCGSSKDVPDARFGPYVDIYNSLDSLIWQVPGFFLASTAVIFGFIANTLSRDAVVLPRIVWAGMFLFTGMLLLVGTYSMYRIRQHHTRMGLELRRMEPIGYFHFRGQLTQRWWPPSAPHVFMVFFAVIGIASLILAGLVLLDHPSLYSVVGVSGS